MFYFCFLKCVFVGLYIAMTRAEKEIPLPHDVAESWEEAFTICRKQGAFLLGKSTLEEPGSKINESETGLWISLRRSSAGYMAWNESSSQIMTHTMLTKDLSWSPRKRCSIWIMGKIRPEKCISKHKFICIPGNERADALIEKPVFSVVFPSSGLDVKKNDPVVEIKANRKFQGGTVRLHCDSGNDGFHYYLVRDGVHLGRRDALHISKTGLAYTNVTTTHGEYEKFVPGIYWCEVWVPFSNSVRSSNAIVFLDGGSLATAAVVTLESDTQMEETLNAFWDTTNNELRGKLLERIPAIEGASESNWKFVTAISDKGTIRVVYHLFLRGDYQKMESDVRRRRDLKFIQKCDEELFSALLLEEEKAVTIKWPDHGVTDNIVSSEPQCLTTNHLLVTRKCTLDGKFGAMWDPTKKSDEFADVGWYPVCRYVQPSFEAINKCPPGYRNVAGICVLVTEFGSWDSTVKKCQRSGSPYNLLDIYEIKDRGEFFFKEVVAELKTMRIESVWLEARRRYPFGPIVRMLPGNPRSYGTKYEKLKDYKQAPWAGSEPKLRGDCLTMSLSGKLGPTLRMDNCNVNRPTVCVLVLDENMLIEQSCPKDFYTSRYYGYRDRCFANKKVDVGVTWNRAVEYCPEGSTLMQIPSPYLNLLYKYVAKDSNSRSKRDLCWFGVEKDSRERIIWTKTGEQVRYVNWIKSTNFSLSKGAVAQNGSWTLMSVKDTLNCVACERTIDIPEPQMYLIYNEVEDKLQLVVFGMHGLWKPSSSSEGIFCFTDDTEKLISRVDIKRPVEDSKWTQSDFQGFGTRNRLSLQIRKTVFEFNPDDGTGHYWCEAYRLKDFETIWTRPALVVKRRLGFALTLDVRKRCWADECEPTYSSLYRDIAQKLETKLWIRTDIAMKRILHEGAGNVRALFHIWIRRSYSRWSEEEAYLRLFNAILYVIQSESSYTLVSLRSTRGCLPSRTEDKHTPGGYLLWDKTHVGVSVTSQQLCLRADGMPVISTCEGNFTTGGYWSPPTGSCENFTASELTVALHRLARYQDGQLNEFTSGLTNLTSSPDLLTTVDLYYTALVLKKIGMSARQLAAKSTIDVISKIMENVLTSDKKRIITSQELLNSSNILLDGFETILQNMQLENFAGFVQKVTPKVAVLVSDPTYGKLTGIALVRKNTSTFQQNDLTSYTITPLYSNNLMDLIVEMKPDVAVLLPEEILQHTVNGSRPRIVISLFSDDLPFQVAENRTGNATPALLSNRVNSRVISVSLPGMISSILPKPIPILFQPFHKNDNTTDNKKRCVYWDFEANNGLGNWSDSGCIYAGNISYGLDVCVCTHLTHFAELITLPEIRAEIAEHHLSLLSTFTILGCILSLIGITGIFATAVSFKQWRNRLGSKVLLNLATVLFIEMTLFLVAASQSDISGTKTCIFLGMSLHYIVLASFCWMLVIGILQYYRFVRVFSGGRPPNVLARASWFAWGAPLIPVIILLSIDPALYDNGSSSFCYPSGVAFYVAVLLPVCITLAVNIAIFVLITFTLVSGRNSDLRSNQSEYKIAVHQLRLCILLFFLLGLTWVFGIFAIGDATLVFAYLFCLTASLQGLILFLFFILFDKTTRSMWATLIQETWSSTRRRKTVSPASSLTNISRTD